MTDKISEPMQNKSFKLQESKVPYWEFEIECLTSLERGHEIFLDKESFETFRHEEMRKLVDAEENTRLRMSFKKDLEKGDYEGVAIDLWISQNIRCTWDDGFLKQILK